MTLVLSATVAALAVHASIHRVSSATGPARVTPKTAPKPVVHPASAVVAAPTARRYGDVSSASARRRLIVDQLRALGVPNDVLALVAMADFDDEWDDRFAACWGDPAKMERVQLEKDMSKDAAMRAALGAAGFRQWDTKTMLWEAMSTPVDVTPAEAESIYALKKNLQQRQFALALAQMNGTMDRAQVIAAVQASYADYNQELKALLGEQRYAKSQQLDDDFMAANLRSEVAGLNPSDAQFQALFTADKQWNKALGALNPGAPNYLDQFKAVNEARDAEYERILGPDAFHHLREGEDAAVVQMKKYENLWGLDEAKIDSVYDTMNGYRKAVGDYQLQVQALQRQGQNVDWGAVNAQLQQMTKQVQQSLQAQVGQESFNRLQRNAVLRWAGPGFRPSYGATPQ